MFPVRAYVLFLMPVFSLWAAGVQAKNAGLEAGPSTFLNNLTDEERAWLREHPVIRVVQDPGWPPVEFADEQGNPSGMSMDYLQLAEQRLGVTFELVRNLTWSEAYEKLKQREIDMTTCVSVTAQREAFWAFTKPYLSMPIVIAAQMDIPFISSMRELTGKKVAVVEGYAVCDWLSQDYPDIRQVRVPSALEGLESLRKGEVFAYIDNLLIIGYFQAKLKLSGIKIAGQTPFINAQCMAVRKDWAILAGMLQKALASIPEKERREIYRKWIPDRYEHDFNYPLLIQASLIFVGILLLLIFWNRKLVREIHSRRHAEEALRESEHTLRESQMIAGIGSYVLDIPAGIWKSSDVLDAILGLTHVSDHTLKGWVALVHPDDREALAEAFRRNVLEQGMNYNREYRIIRPDNREERWIHVLGRIERGPDGQPLRLHGTIQDITVRKLAELEKTRLESQLLQAQKMESVGRLAGGVAHDFNNMLGVILGHTELAIEHVAAYPALKADLLEIRSAAERSVNLTRQLLAFARKQTIAPVVLNLNETVAGMLNMLQRLIGEAIGLNWHPQAGLWPVSIDPSQVDQLLANLCVNARDAIHNVGTITIETGNRTLDADYCATRPGFKPGDYVQLSVSDNGSGINPESMPHLFEPFFTTKVIGQGTGLGLATVYGIVKQNSGFINVYSEPGRGTTFTIYLPRHDRTPESIPVAESPEKAPHGRETILLVEDEAMLLQLNHAMLRRMGYTVLAAGSPREAVNLAQTCKETIHLLITDVVMPEMNGRDLAGVIQTIQPGIRLLFMSGYTANVIAHHGVLDESVHFIQKPFSRKDLSEKIRQVLES